MKKRYSEEQIIGFLKQADAALPIKKLCRRQGFSEESYYLWRSKFGGMSVSDAKRLKVLESENTRLKKLLADAMLEQEVTRELLQKNDNRAPRRGGLDADPGLTERHALRVVDMSPSALRYRPAPDRNADLREEIRALAYRHPR